MEDVLEKSIIKWAATRVDEVVFAPQNGFYSIDIVLDAFQKGKETGEGNFKQFMRDMYFSKFELVATAIGEIYNELLQKKFTLSKFFVNHSLSQTIILLVIDEKIHDTDSFIEFAYPLVSKSQTKYLEKGLNLSIDFISQNENINTSLIKSDGYDYGYDFTTNDQIK